MDVLEKDNNYAENDELLIYLLHMGSKLTLLLGPRMFFWSPF